MKLSSFRFFRFGWLPLLALSACVPDQTEPVPNAAQLNFSNYVAVGDLYSAGFSNGGVTPRSQLLSFPNLLAYQFSLARPGISFVQPIVGGEAGTGYLRLRELSAAGLPLTERVPVARQNVRAKYLFSTICGTSDTAYVYSRAQNTKLPNNLAVPGLRLAQLNIAGLGSEANAMAGTAFNSYFERLLPANDSRTYLRAVNNSKATFFTLLVGLEDILPYALKGGECVARPNTSTNKRLREDNLRTLLDSLTANGRPGAVASIPALGTLPYFQVGRGLRVQELVKATIYVLPSNSDEVRPIDNEDRILPAYLSLLGQPVAYTTPDGSTASLPYGLDARVPLTRGQVLDQNEFIAVNQIITDLNTLLKNLTDPKSGSYKYQVAFVDVNQLFQNISGSNTGSLDGGFSINGVEYSGVPVRGNFFSLDLYSLTPRGNGLVANTFLRQINSYYGTNLPLLDVNTLPTTSLPL